MTTGIDNSYGFIFENIPLNIPVNKLNQAELIELVEGIPAGIQKKIEDIINEHDNRKLSETSYVDDVIDLVIKSGFENEFSSLMNRISLIHKKSIEVIELIKNTPSLSKMDIERLNEDFKVIEKQCKDVLKVRDDEPNKMRKIKSRIINSKNTPKWISNKIKTGMLEKVKRRRVLSCLRPIMYDKTKMLLEYIKDLENIVNIHNSPKKNDVFHSLAEVLDDEKHY